MPASTLDRLRAFSQELVGMKVKVIVIDGS